MPEECLALFGGTPVRTRPWAPWPVADGATLDRLAGVIASGRWTLTNPSPPVPTLEREVGRRLAERYGHAHCVPVSSGSAALRMSLLAVGVRPLDRVLVPALTWAAVASAVINVGAMPVPVDVSADNLCLDPAAARAAIAATCPRAMVVVHQNCAIASVEELARIAEASSVSVIEDCSQAHGARIGVRPIGTFGVAATFSFQQNKLLTCGEGGAVATSDDELYRRLQQFHAVG